MGGDSSIGAAIAGIPPALDGDDEDVIWALRAAEALWALSERSDALIWLGRAARAAEEAHQNPRAEALGDAASVLGRIVEDCWTSYDVMCTREVPTDEVEHAARIADATSMTDDFAASLVDLVADDEVEQVCPTAVDVAMEDPQIGYDLAELTVDALSDVPHETRTAFMRSASITRLARDHEVRIFALMLLVEGELEWTLDAGGRAPACFPLRAGAALSMAAIEHASARITCRSPEATVALWDDAAFSALGAARPHVEEKLRASARSLFATLTT